MQETFREETRIRKMTGGLEGGGGSARSLS